MLHGCAVGGGSITYANVLLRPPEEIWKAGTWAGLAKWQAEMPSHYDAASRMLGVAKNHILGPGDLLLKKAAEAEGVGDTFYSTPVGVFLPPEGEEGGVTSPDPYFGGAGPARTTCIACGGCMMGCPHGAKNTLDLNYLYLAEKNAAQIFAETQVVDVKPLEEASDGGAGYEIRTVKSTARFRKWSRRFTCRGVVFAASSLGTTELLFRLKERGSLPGISECLGRQVRTNSESLIGVRVPRSQDDLSKGVAIGSGVHIDQFTHVEAVRYPSGSDTMGLLATILTGGRPGQNRALLWLRNFAFSMLRHPLRTLRLLLPWKWARECIILLCMQTLDEHIDLCLRRSRLWPFRKVMVTRGTPMPAHIPHANEFAAKLARICGGTAMSMIIEILFDVPGTAHSLGGCTMGNSASTGVVDAQQRVFGYRNMYVCDGSVVSANLGVNPSLTITALAERAMSFVPPAPVPKC